MEILSDPALRESFGLTDSSHLQTIMFLQLVAGGHLLLFVTRSEGWFLKPPYPAVILVGAIVATQLLAVIMCAFGILVPAIAWPLIGWVWLYNIVWIFLLGGVRLVTERLFDHVTARRMKSAVLVAQPLMTNTEVSRH